MKREFNKLSPLEILAERVDQALVELRSENPTDALRTLEKAKRETVTAREYHRQQLHLEFWK